MLEAVRRFLLRFYRAASDKRKRDVCRQLGATLEAPGAKLAKGMFVLAHSPERFVAKIAEIMREGVNDDDKAIVVLLLKLGDTSDGSAPGVAAAADVERDERASESDIAKATAWLSTRPNLAALIDDQLDERGMLVDDVYSAQVREMARTALVVKAWRDRPPDDAPH